MKKKWKIAGINFDHFHMGDLLRMVHNHPDADIAGICDHQSGRMDEAKRNFDIPTDRIFHDEAACMEQCAPDIVILCPSTADHAEWTERIAPYGVHILMEKPFAASLEEADRMISAMKTTGKQLAINWPLRWYASHTSAYRFISEGMIGDVLEVHYYDGNRGPLYHGADKIEKEPSAEEKAESWFYHKSAGGGSLLDYLGYGTTLGTWFHNGKMPLEMTCMTDGSPGLEVDEHSITIARYESGLSKFETRWGTFSDPWTHQPQPKCGFIIKGTQGTLSSYDMEDKVRIQTRDFPEGRDFPAPPLESPFSNPVEYIIHHLENDLPLEGPLSPTISRIGQQMVDTAFNSAIDKRSLPLKA